MENISKDKIISKINENNMEKAYVIAYFYNKVCVGFFEDNDIYFNDTVNYDFLTQIRIFNKEKEIIYVFNEDTESFDFSIVEDENNEDVLDEYMMISGNKIKSKNNSFTTITQIGKCVDLPFEVNEEEVKNGIRLVVRNYFKEDENNQVVISKSRLVGFSKTDGGDLIAEL